MKETDNSVALDKKEEQKEKNQEEEKDVEDREDPDPDTESSDESREEESEENTDREPSSQASRDLAEMVELMDEHDLSELEYEDDDRKIRLKKQGASGEPTGGRVPPAGGSAPVQTPGGQARTPAGSSASGGQGSASPQQDTSQQADKTTEEPTDEDAHIIKSPLVGTFYRAPSPEADPFVEEGDHVDEDTVVCIIEAMKVMNEIDADVEGTVKEILVNNGEPVDFDQPIFKIDPAD